MTAYPAVLTDEQLAKLASTDTPTVANVIDLFGVRSSVAGYTNQALKAVYPGLPPAVGYAVTATFRSAYPSDGTEVHGGMPQIIADAMAVPAPRMMVFQDLDDPPRAATYGETMTLAYQRFGFVGTICHGGGRDVAQIREFKYPCWATAIFCSRGHATVTGSMSPVVVGGLTVRPGDLLHADENGILSIPHSIAGAVAELCAPYLEMEAEFMRYLRGASVDVAGYGAAVKKLVADEGKLKQRARDMLGGAA